MPINGCVPDGTPGGRIISQGDCNMIFKCKMCGGALEVTDGASIAECPYCGTRQTLPRLDDEKRANLYDRAGHFRRMSDFDKAMTLYEEILREDATDAEAYWSIVLCRYGIEYVEDPATHRRVPTVNRAQLTSILADEDYKAALEYADGHQRELYEAEAKEIEGIQRGILAISEKEEPFDVFICYKETDERGVRTRDSVLANDLYYELTNEGYKVFFSRITLEDKLGTAYEPYIFAALQSARVMVVVGTKPEYLNAPWVKNEWSRYLALIRSGAKKTLIPAYRDMDPYDLPDAFSHLQAQDMSKLGFMQDLTRGIRKLLAADAAKPAVREGEAAEALLKRAFISLEDGEWEQADGFCEQVLNLDPECGRAYLGKVMAERHAPTEEALAMAAGSFEDSPNYRRACRFDPSIQERLQVRAIDPAEAAAEETYRRAVARYRVGEYEALAEAAELFASIPGYRDADVLRGECYRGMQMYVTYWDACELMKQAKTAGQWAKAANAFAQVPHWLDADERRAYCLKKKDKFWLILGIGLVLAAAVIWLLANC